MAFPSKNARIFLLLLVLLFVAIDAWVIKERTTAWESSRWLVIYPVNGDGSQATEAFIAQLEENVFEPIISFFDEEAGRYGINLDKPIEVKLAPKIDLKPPAIPTNGGPLDIIWWSLKLRYWSWKHDNFDGPADLQLFVQFYDPDKTKRLAHSTGLEKGLVGIVNAFAAKDYLDQNNVVIAHEALHLFGATDKYDLTSNQPYYPQGFAEPEQMPLFPQQYAELMGGRIPISKAEAVMPSSLDEVLIGSATALEINWAQ